MKKILATGGPAVDIGGFWFLMFAIVYAIIFGNLLGPLLGQLLFEPASDDPPDHTPRA